MKRKVMVICKNCKEEKIHYAKKLCRSCYVKQKLKVKKICKNCGKLKTLYAKELCEICYAKQKPKVVCKKCDKLKQLHAKGMCKNCYMLCYTHEKGLNKSMSENKSCAMYLGVIINEQLLSKVFKDVKQRPYGNPGYDFICNKEMKVDAKSSVIRTRGKCKTNSWHFQINKNSIADYFFCVAYDNRKNLNLLYMWLIPGKDVNGKTGIQISESKLHKWSQYEQPIDKALLCCNKMKEM